MILKPQYTSFTISDGPQSLALKQGGGKTGKFDGVIIT